jgi:serine/threonine protein kinase
MGPPKYYARKLKSFIKSKNSEVDDDGLDLLDKMLQYNPDKRITPDEALAHK